jgi:hypothetical protein
MPLRLVKEKNLKKLNMFSFLSFLNVEINVRRGDSF